MFFLTFAILLSLTFDQSMAICPTNEHCDCTYDSNDDIYTFVCTSGDLWISLKVIEKSELHLGCANVENEGLYALLPTLDSSFFSKKFLRLVLGYMCHLPRRYSLLTANFPNLNELNTIALEIKNINNGFFDQPNSSLETYDVTSNFLETLDENIFVNLTNLRNIDLSWNSFKYLPSKLFQANSFLKTVSICFNLGNLILGDGLLANKPSLATVLLINNENISIPDDCFGNSTNLTKIDLSGNNIVQPNV